MRKLPQIDIRELDKFCEKTLLTTLDIKFTEIGETFLVAEMPVNERVHQPAHILHGGASVALAESVGSMASALLVDLDKFDVVGIEINANHLRPVRKGMIHAKAEMVHIGGKLHVWDIAIKNEQEKLVCKSRLTMMVIPKQG